MTNPEWRTITDALAEAWNRADNHERDLCLAAVEKALAVLRSDEAQQQAREAARLARKRAVA